MSDLLAARTQMALSLGFHIVFAEIGIAMPVLTVLAEWRWYRTGDRVYLDLAKRWAKGSAILFAVGAVSGTVLSFELGLLWPRFMELAGPIIGIPFSLEGSRSSRKRSSSACICTGGIGSRDARTSPPE
jgi:cytochrome d ubiquinol oxidase subunit I